MLRAEIISKQYMRRNKAIFAVRDVSFILEAGDFVTLTGSSGSGKTTFLSLLCGLARPTSGSILFEGKEMGNLSDAELSTLRRTEISYIPQGASLLGNFTVFDNIRITQAFAGKDVAASAERAAYLMEQVGIAHLALEYPKNLSGGEMRRVAIARALFNTPRILLADEPTSDLDPKNAQAVMELFQSINAHGTALVLATHDQSIAAMGKTHCSMQEGHLQRS